MTRQRLRARTSPLALLGRLLVLVLACALVWYGLMLLLLAFKLDPDTVNAISGYRSVFDFLAGLAPDDLDGVTAAIVAVAGVVAFLLFAYLAFKELPRPYLARHDLGLADDDHGSVTVEPRAVERLAEIAAERHAAVASASGRFGAEELSVAVTVRRARELATTLEAVQSDVVAALERHGLPAFSVHLTLTGFERRTRRELD